MNKKILCLFLLTTGLSYANNYSVVIKQEKNNYIANIKEGSQKTIYGEWTNTGELYNCTEWSDAPDSIDYGASYDSTRDCSQDQYRDVSVYDVWTNGEDTLNNTYQEIKTIDVVDNSTFNKVLYVNRNTLTGTRYNNNFKEISTNVLNNNFTMEAWVKPYKQIKTTTTMVNGDLSTDGISGESYLFFPEHGGTGTGKHGGGISVGTNGIKVFAHSANYMPALFVSYRSIPSTSWTHISVSVLNNVPYVYINGSFIGSGYAPANSGILIAPTTIGSDHSSSGVNYGNLNADVAIARIWSHALTSTEIANNYNKYIKLNKVIGNATLFTVAEQVKP